MNIRSILWLIAAAPFKVHLGYVWDVSNGPVEKSWELVRQPF